MFGSYINFIATGSMALITWFGTSGAVADQLNPSSTKPILMRVSYKVGATGYFGQGLATWADSIERNSGYRIVVKLYPGDSLFVDDLDYKPAPPDRTNYYQVKDGRIEAAMSEHFYWFDITNILPEMSFALRPYAFANEQNLRAFPTSETAKIMNRLLEEKGVHNLGWFFIGTTNAFLAKPHALMRPQDFKGMRLRTTGRGFDESISGLGAVAVHMNGAETIIKALRSGELDGMYIGAIYNIPSRNLDKEASFMTISPYDAEYFHLYANLKWWNDLPADLRKVIDDATRVSEQAILDAQLKNTSDTVAKLKSDGALSIATTSADDIAALQRVARPAFDDFYLKATGQDGRRILDTMSKQ